MILKAYSRETSGSMTMDMKKWVSDIIHLPVKRPLPILSFPCVQLTGATVRELVNDSTLQANGMKAVADRIPSAASVSLMDLSVEAEAFGSAIRMNDDEVPTVSGAIVSDEDSAEALKIPAVGTARTGVYIEAVRKAAGLITDRPIFAGMIGPFSLAGRLMDVNEIMYLCYDEPETVHSVLRKVTEFLTAYAQAYREAGANGVIVAEPLAGLLSPALAAEFSHIYMKELVESVQTDDFAVFYHNCGNTVPMMKKDIYSIGAIGYHFGDAVKMKEMLDGAPEDVLVMGNVSPAEQFLSGTPDSVRKTTLEIMKECCVKPNFVISSGCDIPPKAPWDNIDAFFTAAEEFYS